MKEYKFRINGVDYTSSVDELEEGHLKITLNGKVYQVEVPEQKPVGSQVIHHVVHHVGVGATAKKAPSKMPSPMPGTVTKINVSRGQEVKKGEVLLVIEAMKMENDIVAEGDGTIKSVKVTLGQNVIQGDILVEFEGAAEEPASAAPKASAPKAAPGSKTVVAPLPGTVKRITVKMGQEVKRGETVVIIEAMKMENNIAAETNGKVKSILVRPDQQVTQGEALIELE